MAASALLVDYVMTVAVSVTAGVVAVTSAFRELVPHTATITALLIVLLALVNLRGARQSGRVFAVPTYGFVAVVLLMFVVAAVRAVTTGLPPSDAPILSEPPTVHTGGILTLALALRAFASGCTALTGVEAISNGVPAFEKPKARNAATTLAVMGALAAVLFTGITVLALEIHARAVPSGSPSVLSQIGASVFGHATVLYYLLQATTAGILILAANTAFNGFPTLASILAGERYLPRQLHDVYKRQLHNRGDRLAFSNGILLLAVTAAVLVLAFNANIDRLIQLYIIGVFTSFTLSQAGMVRHWKRELAGTTDPARRTGLRRAQAINAVGALLTAVVLAVVFATKVPHGAWLAVVAMVVLFFAMRSISVYYRRFEAEVSAPGGLPTLPPRVTAVVLVSRLHQPALHALALARATRPDRLDAVSVEVDEAETRTLCRDWERRGIDVPLLVLSSPYRELVRPVVDHVRRLRQSDPAGVVTVFVPVYVVTRWWQNLLHNQSALRLRARLMATPGVVVVSVPYHLGRADQGWLSEVDIAAPRHPEPTRRTTPTP